MEINEQLTKATLRLFKAVPLANKGVYEGNPIDRETIPLGFVFSKKVNKAIISDADLLIFKAFVTSIYGLSAEKLNQSFHKSWAKIKNTSMEQLVVEQLAHYLTTYGKQEPIEYLEEKQEQWMVDELAMKVSELPDINLGKVLSRDPDYIYIPKEELNIPDLTEDLKLVIIKGYTKEELKEKVLALLGSGIALAEKTITDVEKVLEFTGIQEKELSLIKNKEVRVILYKQLGQIPANPTEFLRYLIYNITGKTLLIKNYATITEIKEKNNTICEVLLIMYQKLHGLEKLAEIFYRYKPLWIAMRGGREERKIINKIRRLARDYHKPMPEDFLNNVTCMPKSDISGGDYADLDRALTKANTFRKIRLAYALNFRLSNPKSILYRIRNGKSFAKEFSLPIDYNFYAKALFDMVLVSIVQDIKSNVEGKSIYIPDYINYALPATEKMFTGNFPTGTYVSVPNDMIFGIHWSNVKDKKESMWRGGIDLDLSTISKEGKIGWDAGYRNYDSTILFSGDITDAPNGATELFYVSKQQKSAHILMVNYYNFDPDIEVPFKILVAQEEAKIFGENYMVNPNNVMAVTNSTIKERQKILGLAVTTLNGCRFYFTETGLGASITSSNNDYVAHARQYLFDYYENSISLNELLTRAGAIITNDVEDEVDIDLAPENIEKDTIIKILTKKEK